MEVTPQQTTTINLSMALTLPTIAALTPSVAAPGSTVTITGDNFGSSDSSQLLVFFGSTLASKQRLSDHIIKVTVPDSAVNGEVTVVVGGNQSNGARFTVIKQIMLGWTTKNLLLAHTLDLTASAKDSDGRLIVPTPDILWSVLSGDAVNLSGTTVTGVKEGAASIKASNGGVAAVGTVNVFEVSGVGISQSSATVAPLAASSGNSVTLVASASCTDGVDRGVTWSSSNPAVVTVNGNGVVQAAAGVNAGTATVTATSVDDPRFSASATITVVKPGVSAVTLSPASLTLNAMPESGQPSSGYVTTGTFFADVTATIPTHGVTWSTSDSTRITVDSAGHVQTVAGAPEGTAIVTATSADDPTIQATASVNVTIFGSVKVGIQ